MAKLFIVSAPSGAGKTTLVTAVIGKLPPVCPVERVITYTTKPVGPGEIPGVDYHYIGHDEFVRKIEQGFFLEWSTAYGNHYGSPASVIERVEHGTSMILILDRCGAQSVLSVFTAAVLIWIYPPDLAILESRLRARARDNEQEINNRLKLAQAEMAQEELNPVFFYHLPNENFQLSCEKLREILLSELHCEIF